MPLGPELGGARADSGLPWRSSQTGSQTGATQWGVSQGGFLGEAVAQGAWRERLNHRGPGACGQGASQDQGLEAAEGMCLLGYLLGWPVQARPPGSREGPLGWSRGLWLLGEVEHREGSPAQQ